VSRSKFAWGLAGLALALLSVWFIALRGERIGAERTERGASETQVLAATTLVPATAPPEVEEVEAEVPKGPETRREPLVTSPDGTLGVIEGVVSLDGRLGAFRSGTVRVWWNHARGVPRKGNLATAAPVWPGADGRFRITGLPLDVPLVLRANSDHGPDFALDLEPFVAGERRELEVALETSTRIHGYVFDPAGLPLEGRELRLLHQLPAGAEATHSRDRIATTTSDAEGAFQFTRVPHGLWELEAGPEGRVEARAVFDTRPGDVGPLRLVLVTVPTSSLEVRLRWADGSVPESIFYAVDGNGHFKSLQLSAGLVTLPDLTHGVRTIQLSAQDDDRAGSVETRISVPYEGTLELELVEKPMRIR